MGGFSYPDQYIYETDFAGVLGVVAVIYFLVLMFASVFSMACYVLQSLGLYTIAGRRGIKHNWLAWVPFGNLWILGSISDQYQYLVKGKIKNRRKVMLGLAIGVILIYFVWFVGMMISAFSGEEVASVLWALLGMLALLAVAISLAVLQYMAYYDLYSSCQPNNAVLYLVLSILFSVTMPFFVFFCRKKDLGMPPRKQPAPQQVVVPTVEPVVDPTVVEQVVVPTVEPVVDPTVVEKMVIPTVEPVTEEGYAAPEEFEDE